LELEYVEASNVFNPLSAIVTAVCRRSKRLTNAYMHPTKAIGVNYGRIYAFVSFDLFDLLHITQLSMYEMNTCMLATTYHIFKKPIKIIDIFY